MIRSITLAALAAAALVACGSKEAVESETKFGEVSANPVLEALPATVEGVLDMSLGEGSEDEEGADMAFGGLVVGKENLYIQVDSKLLESMGLPTEGAKVRATIGSRDDLGHGMFQYRITALEKL
jgi:hypothetical protein